LFKFFEAKKQATAIQTFRTIKAKYDKKKSPPTDADGDYLSEVGTES